MANNKGLCSSCKTIMREYWIKLHLEKDIPITHLAKLSGFHQDTLYLWKSKYNKDGLDGLKDKSKAPHYHPNQYSASTREKIIFIRNQGLKHEKRHLGPKIIALRLQKHFGLLISPAGIGKFLNKAGLIPKERQRRIPKKTRVKQCKIFHPGELIQMDIKYAVKSTRNHWFYQYSAIDCHTGIAYGVIYELTSNFESVLFLHSIHKFFPFKIIGVQTDNDTVFTNYYTGYRQSTDPMHPRLHPFDVFCNETGITHYLISPGKPTQNGKVERFHRTCEEEFYQSTKAKDLNTLRKQLRDYLYYYNNERENLGLGGLTPLERLKTIPEYDKIKVLMP